MGDLELIRIVVERGDTFSYNVDLDSFDEDLIIKALSSNSLNAKRLIKHFGEGIFEKKEMIVAYSCLFNERLLAEICYRFRTGTGPRIDRFLQDLFGYVEKYHHNDRDILIEIYDSNENFKNYISNYIVDAMCADYFGPIELPVTAAFLLTYDCIDNVEYMSDELKDNLQFMSWVYELNPEAADKWAGPNLRLDRISYQNPLIKGF